VDPILATPGTVLLPAVVESGTFTTEAFIANLGPAPRTYRATLVCNDGCPASPIIDMTLPGHGTTRIANVAAAFRAVAPVKQPLGVATMLLTATDPNDMVGIVAMARTSSVVPPQGAFGVAYPAIRLGEGAPYTTWISGVQQNDTNRSNLAFVNLGDLDTNPIGLRLEIYDGTSGVKVVTYDDPRLSAIPARGFVQINSFLATLAPTVQKGYVRVTRTSGLSSFVGYGVVNDGAYPGERTGDGAYVAMEVPYR
jgi:hypothetical protein